MSEPNSIREPLIKWSIWFAFWTLIGLAFGVQFYSNSNKAGQSLPLSLALTNALLDWYVWAILSLPATWLARHFPLTESQWVKSIFVHLPACAVFSLAYAFLRSSLDHFRTWEPQYVSDILIYWVVVTVTHAMIYYQRYLQRELRSVELERMLTQSKLQALQMQLNPHFLFNTLHAISSLMHTDVKAADKTITRLSDLLRYVLDKSNVQEVPLKEELQFLDGYLEIQKTRFGDRLTVQKSISAEALDAQVPNLILQPIVENAIRHGIEPNAKPGVLELCAQRRDSELELQVNDNGAGLSEDAANRARIGLSNTRIRLEQLYGTTQKFTLENRPNGGVAATLVIPFHTRNGAPAEGTHTK